MSAKTIPSPWPRIAFALSFSPAAAIALAGLAQAEIVSEGRAPSQIAGAPAATVNFDCEAQPGGWCDLRDWSGMDRSPAASNAPAPRR